MYCPNCGKQIPDHAIFCSNCGTKINLSQMSNGAAGFQAAGQHNEDQYATSTIRTPASRRWPPVVIILAVVYFVITFFRALFSEYEYYKGMSMYDTSFFRFLSAYTNMSYFGYDVVRYFLIPLLLVILFALSTKAKPYLTGIPAALVCLAKLYYAGFMYEGGFSSYYSDAFSITVIILEIVFVICYIAIPLLPEKYHNSHYVLLVLLAVIIIVDLIGNREYIQYYSFSNYVYDVSLIVFCLVHFFALRALDRERLTPN